MNVCCRWYCTYRKPCINSYCYNIYSRKRELSFAVCLMREKRVDKSTWHVQRSLTYSYAFTKCVQWLHTIVESNKCSESIIGNNHAYIYYIFLQTNYRSQRTKRMSNQTLHIWGYWEVYNCWVNSNAPSEKKCQKSPDVSVYIKTPSICIKRV